MFKTRIIIRPPTSEDCVSFLKAVRASVALHHPWVYPPQTPEAFGEYLRRLASDDHDGRLICLRHSGELVGAINLNNIIRGAFQNAFLGYYVFAPFVGRGLMREGLELTLAYAFRDLKLHRVEANIQPENTASIALAKRCGFTQEGFSKRYLQVDGRWRDHERWALLVEDWEARSIA